MMRISVDICKDEVCKKTFQEQLKFSIDLEHYNVKNIKEKVVWLLSLQGLDPEEYWIYGKNEIFPLTDQTLYKHIVLQKSIPTVRIKVKATELEVQNKSFWTQFTFPFGNFE